MIPLCPCHGEPMRWNKDSRYAANGRWRCFVTKREKARVFYEAHREAELARRQRIYWTDPIGECRRREERRRAARILRMETELKELLNAP